MPKIPSYTDDSGVQLNMPLAEGTASRIKIDTDPISAANNAQGRALGGFAQLFNTLAIRTQAAVDNTHVSNAVAAAMDDLNKQQLGYLDEKGENVMARDATDTEPAVKSMYDRWQESSHETILNARNTLQNDAQRRAFDASMNTHMTTMNMQMAKHQIEQLNAASEQSSQAEWAALQGSAALAIRLGNWDGLDQSFDAMVGTSNRAAAIAGTPLDALKVKNNEAFYKFGDTQLDTLLAAGKINEANELIKHLEKRVDDNQLSLLKVKIADGSIDITAKNAARDFVSKHVNSDGSIDWESVYRDRDEWLKGRTTNNVNAFTGAIVGQESGGDYNAVGADLGDGTSAFGKYQITPGLWAQIAPPGTPMTPENQDKYGRAELERLYKKYGPEGAAVAWYAGEGNAERWVKGMTTAIGDNGTEYSWDAKQGEAPSVREYVNSIIGRMGAGKAEVDPRMEQAVNRQIEVIGKEVENKRKQELNSAVKNMMKFSEDRSKTPADIEAQARVMSGGDPTLFKKFLDVGLGVQGVLEKIDRDTEERLVNDALDELFSNPNVTKEELLLKYPELARSDAFQKAFAVRDKAIEKSSKWDSDANKQYFKDLISANKLDNGFNKSDLMYYVDANVAKEVRENGGQPLSDARIQQIMANGVTEIKRAGTFFGTSNTGKIRANMYGVTATGDDEGIDEYGNTVKYDKRIGRWYIETR